MDVDDGCRREKINVNTTENRKDGGKAWRPKCASPRLVYDFALFETFMHVHVRAFK